MKYAALALSSVLMPCLAQAASFDCAKAGTAQENLVCTASNLSKADEDLASLYARQLAKLTPLNQGALKKSQRSWITFREKACGLDAQCVATQYEARTDFLKKAVETRGPWTFAIIDQWRFIAPATAVEEYPGQGAMQYAEKTRLVIDAPLSDDARAFNAALAKRFPDAVTGFDGAEESGAGFALNEATPDFISLDLFGWTYPVGAAHGIGAAEHVNYLMAERREVKASDVFAPGSGWQKALAALVLADLQKQAGAEDQPLFEEAPDAVAAMSPDPANWVITAKGLGVNFSVYSVGPYSFGDRTVDLPWAALKPYLAKDSPLPFWR